MSQPTFAEIPYRRPDLADLHEQITAVIADLNGATSANDQIAAVNRWNALRFHTATAQSVAEVRYTQNVKDPTWKAEKEFYDEQMPTVMEWNAEVERILVESPHRAQLEQEYGTLFFTRMENSLRVFAPEIKALMVEESKLADEYNEITASARIELDGETFNLSTIGRVAIELDRERRKRAVAAQYAFLGAHKERIDAIYDKLVKLRTQKARQLGFPSYTEFRYVEFGRVDYTAADVERFRQNVVDHVVPLVAKLKAAQAKRLGLDGVMLYDERLQFADGNPIAEGDKDFIVDAATTMYRELSPETREFFDTMLERELMDLESRDNKATGGYCTSFPDHGVPFIFANFNRTTHDVEVLTHEAGHAFQAYRSRNHRVPEYLWPTAEACEIHSMGMEFLTWPWMDKFFGTQTDKFKFYHLAGALIFLPYGCAVDHFQHWVYANPEATPAERNAQWKAMEELYLPWRNAAGIPEAEEGRQWQFQRHIIESPFYYIDYALAQTCALQYWQKSLVDRNAAFAEYLRICDIGGSQPFLQIVQSGGLISPFEPSCLDTITDVAYQWLDEHYPTYLHG